MIYDEPGFHNNEKQSNLNIEDRHSDYSLCNEDINSPPETHV